MNIKKTPLKDVIIYLFLILISCWVIFMAFRICISYSMHVDDPPQNREELEKYMKYKK